MFIPLRVNSNCVGNGFAPLAEAKGIEFVTDNQTTEVLGGDKERILRIGRDVYKRQALYYFKGK